MGVTHSKISDEMIQNKAISQLVEQVIRSCSQSSTEQSLEISGDDLTIGSINLESQYHLSSSLLANFEMTEKNYDHVASNLVSFLKQHGSGPSGNFDEFDMAKLIKSNLKASINMKKITSNVSKLTAKQHVTIKGGSKVVINKISMSSGISEMKKLISADLNYAGFGSKILGLTKSDTDQENTGIFGVFSSLAKTLGVGVNTIMYGVVGIIIIIMLLIIVLFAYFMSGSSNVVITSGKGNSKKEIKVF